VEGEQLFPTKESNQSSFDPYSQKNLSVTGNSYSEGKNNVAMDVAILQEKLKNATPGETLKLNLTGVSPDTYWKALEGLSPKDLATSLGKINAAYNGLPFTSNATSSSILNLLNRLPPAEIAIALKYPSADSSPYSETKLIDKLERGDLAKLLDNLKPSELAIVVDKLPTTKKSSILHSLSPNNITQIIENTPSPVIKNQFGGYKSIVDALLFHSNTDLLSKFSPDFLPLILSEYDEETVEDVLNKIPVVERARILNDLANISNTFSSLPSAYESEGLRSMAGTSSGFSASGAAVYLALTPSGISNILNKMLDDSTPEEINQISLDGYSLATIEEALVGLPKDKQDATLNMLPDDQRKIALEHINK